MEEKEKKPLVFPVNCPPAADYFNGFGQKELLVLLAMSGIALIVMIILWNNYGEVIAMIVTFSLLAITFVCVRRNSQQESLIDQLVQIFKYYRAQKKYEYKYHDEYEV